MSGFSFLSPLGLIGLIGVPLIVLLYMRTSTPAPRRIPSTRFWKNSLTPPSETRRFRPPPITPLFLIHLLAALLIALAIARPASANYLANLGARTQPRHEIIVLDGSTSMAAIADTIHAPKTTRFDLARDAVHNQLGNLRNGDIVTLLLLGTQVQTFQASDTVAIDDLDSKINRIAIPGGRADLNSALRLCQDLLLPGLDDSILIISDGAVAVDPTVAASIPAPITLDQITNTGTDDNLAITEISARSAAAHPGQQDLFLRVVNFSTDPATTTVSIKADSSEISTIDVSLDPGASRNVTQLVPAGVNRVVASLVDTKDAQPLDDTASITLGGDGASGVRVLMVSDTPSALLKALSALPGSQVSVLTQNQYLAAPDTSGIDLVVFEGGVPAAAALPKLPMLIVNPGADFANSGDVMADPQPIRIVAQSPILTGVDLAGVTFGQTPSYTLGANDTEIVGAADGPLIYQSTSANGEPELVLPFDIGQSNFPQRVSFPILVSNLVSDVVARSVPATLSVGDPLIANLRAATSSVTVLDPGMAAQSFSSDQLAPLGTTHQLTFVDTGAPGLYQVQEKDATGAIITTSAVSVNAGQAQESNLKPNPLLAPGLVSGNSTLETSQMRDVADLWPIVLMIVLGLLTLDWLISLRNQRRTRLARAGGTA